MFRRQLPLSSSPAPDHAHRPDWLFRFSAAAVVGLLGISQVDVAHVPAVVESMAAATAEIMLAMAWGIVLGIVSLGLLRQVPREFVMHILGRGDGLVPVLRATCAGVLLDMCSHGILMVGAQLYERGASAGQMVAFLLASPWNSLSLTFILLALLGPGLTAVFIVTSMLVGIGTGLAFDWLVKTRRLPGNPHRQTQPPAFRFFPEARRRLYEVNFGWRWVVETLLDGVRASRMVLRWLLFGVLLTVCVRAVMPAEMFLTWFGPTVVGLLATMGVASILEICSEGSTPLAVDLVDRAGAPGNGFAFLMAGVATDYTEVMVLKETSSSWRLALCLPIVTVPQVLLVAWLMNLLLV